MNSKYDVIIIGGSYAGLSAAMSLGRSLRKTLIIDSGQPCNAPTPHSHNFLTQDGVAPAEIAETGLKQVLKYDTVSLVKDTAISAVKTEVGFEIVTESGHNYYASKLIFATGIKDLLPHFPGFKECWGISAIHCPYCHGYEFKNKKTALYADGDKAMHLSGLIKNLTEDLTILTSGKSHLTLEQKSKLESMGIKLIEETIERIEHEKGFLSSIVFKDGRQEYFTALYAALGFQQHSDLPVALGCILNEQGYIQVDVMQKTSIDGVFACGDNNSMMRSVANAVAQGNMAGAMVNKELC